jgi:hypothetical protein
MTRPDDAFRRSEGAGEYQIKDIFTARDVRNWERRRKSMWAILAFSACLAFAAVALAEVPPPYPVAPDAVCPTPAC